MTLPSSLTRHTRNLIFLFSLHFRSGSATKTKTKQNKNKTKQKQNKTKPKQTKSSTTTTTTTTTTTKPSQAYIDVWHERWLRLVLCKWCRTVRPIPSQPPAWQWKRKQAVTQLPAGLIASRGDSQTTHVLLLTDSMNLLQKMKRRMGSPDWNVPMVDLHLRKILWVHVLPWICRSEPKWPSR